MKVLTLRQPWAGLIVLGIKQMETRSWNTPYRGRLYIHSSASISREETALTRRFAKVLHLTNKQIAVCQVKGSILGYVEVAETYSTNDKKPMTEVGMIEAMLGDYSPDRFFWKCVKPVLLESSVPAKGQLGFWNWDGCVPVKPQLNFLKGGEAL